MNAIWKFAVPLIELSDTISVKMPPNARVLSVGNQNETLCFWCAVTCAEPTDDREFFVIGTGNPAMDEIHTPKRFIGTVQFHGGAFVVHVFDARPLGFLS